MLPYGVTKPQCVNSLLLGDVVVIKNMHFCKHILNINAVSIFLSNGPSGAYNKIELISLHWSGTDLMPSGIMLLY